MEVDIEKNSNEYSGETVAQMEMDVNGRTISIPIQRCTRSHR